SGPLRVGQAPPAAESLVELDIGGEPIAADLRERRLRRIELLLGLQHLVVAGQALAGPARPLQDGVLETSHGRALSGFRIMEFGERGEGVRNLRGGRPRPPARTGAELVPIARWTRGTAQWCGRH